jgi:hypothetical protein
VLLDQHVFLLFEVRDTEHSLFIPHQGKNWLPLEMTLLPGSFNQAVKKAHSLFTASNHKTILTTNELLTEYPANHYDEPLAIIRAPHRESFLPILQTLAKQYEKEWTNPQP